MGAVTPAGKIYPLVRQESPNGLHSVAFLSHLLSVAEERSLVVRGGSPIQRRAAVTQFLRAGAARYIHIERVPFYAPDLNPVEWVWGHLKEVEMRNLVCLDLEDLHMQFHLALERIRQQPHFSRPFILCPCWTRIVKQKFTHIYAPLSESQPGKASSMLFRVHVHIEILT
jgi:transposase